MSSDFGRRLPASGDMHHVFRSDKVLPKVMMKRFAHISDDGIAFYKHEKQSLEPEFVFHFKQDIQLGEVHLDTFDVKPPRISRALALIQRKMDEAQLYSFKISVVKRFTVARLFSMVLGFQSRADADAFRAAVQSQLNGGLKEFELKSSSYDAEYMMVEESLASTSSQPAQPHAVPQPGDVPSVARSAPSVDLSAMKPSMAAQITASKTWTSFAHWNGLATYKENRPGGALLVCCHIAASPAELLQNMVVQKDGSCGFMVFENVRVLDAYPDDNHKLAFCANLKSPGGILGYAMAAGLIARRDVVLEQIWSHEEHDGTYKIILNSVEHPGAPVAARPGYFGDVRAKISHLGITISPLRPDLLQGRASNECLLSMLIQVDIGGSFAVNYLAPLLRPITSVWMLGFLQSLIQMRDALELHRFAVPPYTIMGAVVDEAPPPREMLCSSTFKRPTAASVAPSLLDSVSSTAAEPTGEVESWLPAKYYNAPGGAGFHVRGATYLKDSKKIPASDPVFDLVGVEVCTTDEADVSHISQFLPVVAASEHAFLLVVHFMMPYSGANMHLAIVFAAHLPPDEPELPGVGEHEAECPFDISLSTFVASDDARRNTMFKLVPKVHEGPWIVRQAVGSTPCIIGNKLQTKYFRGSNYLEVSIDISSNSTAASITNFVAGYMSSLHLQLAFILEGKRPEELPEQILGCVGLDHVDLSVAKALDTSTPLASKKKSGAASFPLNTVESETSKKDK